MRSRYQRDRSLRQAPHANDLELFRRLERVRSKLTKRQQWWIDVLAAKYCEHGALTRKQRKTLERILRKSAEFQK